MACQTPQFARLSSAIGFPLHRCFFHGAETADPSFSFQVLPNTLTFFSLCTFEQVLPPACRPLAKCSLDFRSDLRVPYSSLSSEDLKARDDLHLIRWKPEGSCADLSLEPRRQVHQKMPDVFDVFTNLG